MHLKNRKVQLMTTWLVSDTHFFHENLINYRIRPMYDDLAEMDEYILAEWNAMVKPTDKVFHLGDFALGKDFEAVENICKQVNGNVTLCLGNHDTPAKISILSKHFCLCSQFQIDEFLFTHVPVHQSFLEENSLRTNCKNARYNIHGHDHNGRDLGPRYFNVCWDAVEHKPWFMNHFLDLDEVVERLKNDMCLSTI